MLYQAKQSGLKSARIRKEKKLGESCVKYRHCLPPKFSIPYSILGLPQNSMLPPRFINKFPFQLPTPTHRTPWSNCYRTAETVNMSRPRRAQCTHPFHLLFVSFSIPLYSKVSRSPPSPRPHPTLDTTTAKSGVCLRQQEFSVRATSSLYMKVKCRFVFDRYSSQCKGK